MKLTRLAAVAALTAACAFPVHADAIVPSEWAKTFTITFSGYSGSETLTDFPALVRLSTGITGFSYDDFLVRDGNDVPTGADLRFSDINGNILDYEIDTWNPEGESLVWVKVPSLAQNTQILAYYGNINASAQVNVENVWKGYLGVWHLNGNLNDSGPKGLNGEQKGWSVTNDAQVGKGYAGNRAQGNGIQTPSFDNCKTAGTDAYLTLSGWFAPNATGNDGEKDARLFCRKASYNNTSGLDVAFKEGKLWVRGANTGTAEGQAGGAGYTYNYTMTKDEWTHVIIVFDNSNVRAYFNGVQQTERQNYGFQPITANGNQLAFANYARGTTALNRFAGRAYFGGRIDETRAYDGAMSTDRAVAEYQTMAPNSHFAECGTVGPASEGGAATPRVAAAAATDVGALSATLNGSVVDMADAESLTARFCWGLSADALQNVFQIDEPIATTGSVTAGLENLLPNTTYYYKFEASADEGASWIESRVVSFTTDDGLAAFGPVAVMQNEDPTIIVSSVELTALSAATETYVQCYAGTDAEALVAVGEPFILTDASESFVVTNEITGCAIETVHYVQYRATGTVAGAPALVSESAVAEIKTAGRAELSVPTSTVTGDSITMSVDLVKPAAGVTTVSLWFSEDGENYTCIMSWTDVTEAGSFVHTKSELAASSGCHFYFKAEGSFLPDGASEPQLTEVATEPQYRVTGGVITWVGATNTSWRLAENWDKKISPNGFEYDVLIDTNAVACTSRVDLVGNSELKSWRLNSINVGDGCDLQISKSGGSVTFVVSNLVNSGRVGLKANMSGNQQTITLNLENNGTAITEPGAILDCENPETGGRNRSYMRVNINGSVRNEGQFNLVQNAADRCNSVLTLKTAGTLVNNGEVLIKTKGNHASTESYAILLLGSPVASASTNFFAGTGRIVLNMDERAQTFLRSSSIEAGTVKTQTLVNGPDHTITGTGRILDVGVVNRGLIRGIGVNGYLEVAPHPVSKTASDSGTPLINEVDGRIVAVTTNGVFLGNGGNPSTVINRGLLEARADSFIAFRPNATTSLTTQAAMNLELGGTLAGGGEFRASRPIVLTEGAVLKPGDLTLNASGEADGLGGSTVGELSFSTNLTVSAGAEIDMQFVSLDSYDQVSCDGDLVLSGVLAPQSRPHTGRYRAVFKAKGTIDASGLTFSMPGGVSRPRIIPGTYTYDEIEEYEEEIEVEVPVEGGEEGETTTEKQMVVRTRTVQKTGNCLDVDIVTGLSVFIR